MPKRISGRGFDVDFIDLNDDNVKGLFLSDRGHHDFLLFGTRE